MINMNDLTAQGILDHSAKSSINLAKHFLKIGDIGATKRSIARAEESLRKVQRYVKKRDEKDNLKLNSGSVESIVI